MFKCNFELGTKEYHDAAKERLIEIGQLLRSSLKNKEERQKLYNEQCEIIGIMEDYYPVEGHQ